MQNNISEKLCGWLLSDSVKNLALMLFASLLLVACNTDRNFASMPGFKAYFEAYPPKSELPNKQEQRLLSRYKPRIYFAYKQTRFLDFYSDYIAHGRLYIDAEEVDGPIGQADLNQVKDHSGAEFVYSGDSAASTSSTVMAKVEYDTLQYRGQSWELMFLCYNVVFAHSGMVAELSPLARLGLGAIADLDDWHQLDHYVGLTVVLHQQVPIAYFIQRHNYKSTYLVAQQSNWPIDDRVKVDVAFRSNELYPHSPELRRHPGVSFIDKASLAFIETGENKPMMAGWDVTHGQQEQKYALHFLPPDDAFYQFKGRLGQSRRLPGRDGPPGADYVSMPGLMRWSDRLVVSFRPGSIEQEQAKLAELSGIENFTVNPIGIDAYKRDFIQAWQGEP